MSFFQNPAVLGLVRGLGVVIGAAVLSYFADATHLQGIVSPPIAALIASLVLALEQHLEGKGKGSLFGAVKSRS